MGRNKKINKNPRGKKESYKAIIQLDRETLPIWNMMKKEFNVSEWARIQILYHFGKNLNPQQKNQMLREEAQIAAMKLERAKQEYYETTARIQKLLSNDEVSVILSQ